MSDPAVTALQRLVDITERGRHGVAERIRANEQTIYQILNGVPLKSGKPRTVGRNLRERLDKAFPGWLTTSAPSQTEKGVPPSVLLHTGGPQPLYAITPGAMIDPITIPWGRIMQTQPLPTLFKVVITDDAMAPEFPKGCTVIFATEEGKPRARDAVLVSDREGTLFFREYQVGRGGLWHAVAIGGGYQTLDSDVDGLKIIAISMGRWGRRG